MFQWNRNKKDIIKLKRRVKALEKEIEYYKLLNSIKKDIAKEITENLKKKKVSYAE